MDNCDRCRLEGRCCPGNLIVCVNCKFDVCRRFHCYVKCCLCEEFVCDDCMVCRKISDGGRIFRLFWCKKCSDIYATCSFCGEETLKFTLRKRKVPSIFNDTVYKYYYWCEKCEEFSEVHKALTEDKFPNFEIKDEDSPHFKRKRDELNYIV